MSKVRLYGDTSGFVDLKAPDVANDVTITLPNTTGPFATETYVDSAIAGIPGIGSNVVSASSTSRFTTTSTSLVDVTGMTVTITPTSATSKVLVVCSGLVGNNSISPFTKTRIVRDATEIAYVDHYNSTVNGTDFTYAVLDSPATTSATTYKLQLATGNASHTAFFNNSYVSGGGVSFATITAIEVSA